MNGWTPSWGVDRRVATGSGRVNHRLAPRACVSQCGTSARQRLGHAARTTPSATGSRGAAVLYLVRSSIREAVIAPDCYVVPFHNFGVVLITPQDPVCWIVGVE